MYKSIVFYSKSENKVGLFTVKQYANNNKIKVYASNNEESFYKFYNRQSVVVYDCLEEAQDIQNLMSFAKIKMIPLEELNNLVLEVDSPTLMVTNKFQVGYFFDLLHIYPTSTSALLIRVILKNMFNYGMSVFKFKIFNFTCNAMGLNAKVELSALRKFLKDWYKNEFVYLNSKFNKMYVFNKITLASFMNKVLMHFCDWIVGEVNQCDYYRCEHYLEKIYTNDIEKVKELPFFKMVNSRLKVKIDGIKVKE